MQRSRRRTAKRWQSLAASGAVARQDIDEKVGDYTAKQAMVKAAQANVDRLLAMKNFTRLSRRSTASSPRAQHRCRCVDQRRRRGRAGAVRRFRREEAARLRQRPPQTNVPNVQPGTAATIRVPDRSERDVRGDGRSFRAVGQRIVGHDADATRRRQQRPATCCLAATPACA